MDNTDELRHKMWLCDTREEYVKYEKMIAELENKEKNHDKK